MPAIPTPAPVTPTTPVTPTPLAPVQPATPPATPPATVTRTPALQWPPRLAVGQRWVLTLEPVGQWDIALTALDIDRDTFGTANATTEQTSNLQAFFYYIPKEDNAHLYLTDGNGSGYLCVFSKVSVSSNPNDVTMIGAAYRKEPNKPYAALSSICLATWTNAPNAPVSIQPASPSVNPPVVSAPVNNNNPTNGSPTDLTPPQGALALSWAPKIAVDQVWFARISNLGFNISLQRLAAGVARGTATRNGVSGDAFLFYNSSENRLTLEINVGSDQFICSFDIKGVDDKAYNGSVIYRAGSSVAQPLTQRCGLFLLK